MTAGKCTCPYQFDPVLAAQEVDHHLEVLGQVTCTESRATIRKELLLH